MKDLDSSDAVVGRTHEVLNQPEPLTDYNAFEGDTALRAAVDSYGAGAFRDRLSCYGRIAGSEIQALGIDANAHPPELETHDRYGRRIDRVSFHPAYHRLMALGIEAGLTSLTWSGSAGARVARSVLLYLHNQFEAGTVCPMTMSHAAVPALRVDEGVAAEWLPGLLASRYDSRLIPAPGKAGLTIGMAMTEKQGGSDVRANTTRAMALSEPGSGQIYRLRGHKWFCSAPMSDAFLSLAQTDDGLTCFLVPRVQPDGTLNAIRIQRLKHKLGNHSNASSEIEYEDAHARCLGEPGRGVATIIRMVAETRLDCAIGSAALVRQAVAQALDHCRQRTAFGRPLSQQPLMVNVLADLCIESEAMMHFALHLAHRFDQATSDEASSLLARVMTPVAKYWVCKRAVAVINEAQECMGGAGYVEEFILPRLFREAPVNAIWEGSGNVQCLDVLRAMKREPRILEALQGWLNCHAGLPGMETRLERVRGLLTKGGEAEGQARRIVEDLALVMQGAILAEVNSPITEAFAVSRLNQTQGVLLGSLPQTTGLKALIERALPR